MPGASDDEIKRSHFFQTREGAATDAELTAALQRRQKGENPAANARNEWRAMFDAMKFGPSVPKSNGPEGDNPK